MMKINYALLLIILSCFPALVFPQEKTSKELKAERELELQKQTEILVNSKDFVFVGSMAYPQGGRSVNLSTRPNAVKYHPELIESDMPYFGRVYSGAGYGGSDGGLNFSGKPDEFTITTKKKGFLIVAAVKGEGDSYRLTLDVGFDGNAMLTVVCNNRSTISYNGNILPPVKPEDSRK